MPHWRECFAEKNKIERFKRFKALNSNNKYEKRFRDNNQISIHQRHLHALLCEVFKSLNNLNPEFM